MVELSFVELFAGIGGFALGLERTGWKGLWANENNAFCCKVYRERFPETQLDERDIREVQPSDIPAHTLLTAGFPCQDLSVAGHLRGKQEGLDGRRSGLFYEIVRILRHTHSPWFLIENVPGLLTASGSRAFARVLCSLGQLGYGVAWRCLDVASAGLPQSRTRLFVVGHLGDWSAGEVLFELEGGHGDAQAGRRAEALAYCITTRPGSRLSAEDNYVVDRPSPPTDSDGVREASGLPGRVDVPVCECIDGRRYRALGNAVAVPVVEWIGRRLKAVIENDDHANPDPT